MQLPPEFRKIAIVWLCIVGAFVIVVFVLPRLTNDIAQFDRYGFEARFDRLMQAHDHDAALQECLLASAVDPLDIEARYSLGEAFEAGGDATAAAEEFEKAGRTIERFTFVDVRDRSREHRFWFRRHFAQRKWFDACSAFCLLPEDAVYRDEELLDDVATAATELGWWSVAVGLLD